MFYSVNIVLGRCSRMHGQACSMWALISPFPTVFKLERLTFTASEGAENETDISA